MDNIAVLLIMASLHCFLPHSDFPHMDKQHTKSPHSDFQHLDNLHTKSPHSDFPYVDKPILDNPIFYDIICKSAKSNGTGKDWNMDIYLKKEMTFEEWLRYWFETYSRRTVKHSTAVSYIGYINGHIAPEIGSYSLSELNTDILQRFINNQADNGSLKGGGLSPKTLQNMNRMIHKSLEKAMELDLIVKNYASFVEIPRIEETEMRVLTVEEQEQLEKELTTSNEKLAFGVYLSLTLGIRLGEVLGLRWSDIDTQKGIVRIRRTVNRLEKLDGSGTELVVGTPKSKKSLRDIPISEGYCQKLMYYWARSSQIMRKPPKDNDYLLRSAVGGPAEPKTMQETFKRILKAAGVADANFHSLRHTFATRAIEKGADVKTLSVLLGHSDVNITLNRYAHVLDEQKRKTMNLLLGE